MSFEGLPPERRDVSEFKYWYLKCVTDACRMFSELMTVVSSITG